MATTRVVIMDGSLLTRYTVSGALSVNGKEVFKVTASISFDVVGGVTGFFHDACCVVDASKRTSSRFGRFCGVDEHER